MTALLDTHVVLWLLDGSPRLGERTRGWLETQARVYVSSGSLWELAIKQEVGKLTAPEVLPELIERSGLEWLPIDPAHAWGIQSITGLPHRDPFDRVLLAQAHQARLTLLTADRILLGAQLAPAVEMRDASQ